MKSFGEGFAVNVNMRDRDSDIVFDASIHDNESIGGVAQRLNSHMIKLFELWIWGYPVMCLFIDQQKKIMIIKIKKNRFKKNLLLLLLVAKSQTMNINYLLEQEIREYIISLILRCYQWLFW